MILAIDPAPTMSAFVRIDEDCHATDIGKWDNERLLRQLEASTDHVAIEWISSYGMPVGAEVFDTCRWVGRFEQALWHPTEYFSNPPLLVPRRDVKLHHCGTATAKDGNIRQALIDRFAPGQPNAGKGVKNQPGWFYGFHSDIWQAYALAVYYHDTHIKHET